MANLTKNQYPSTEQVDKLLDYLFSDKKSIYIDDITFDKETRSYDVSFCLEYQLELGNVDWKDITIPRIDLLNFILHNNLNRWEAHMYDEISGNLMPVEQIANDIDLFMEDNYRDIIKEYLYQVKCI
jgi:hypothetical protein